MNKIKMYMSASIPYKNEYDIRSITPCIEGFDFRFGYKIIPFNFDDWECKIYNHNNHLVVIDWMSGRSFLKSDGISEDYREDILDVGIDPDQITAETLSHTDEIIRINIDISARKDGKVVDIDDIPFISNIYFIDENNKAYYVDRDKLLEYNKRSKREAK